MEEDDLDMFKLFTYMEVARIKAEGHKYEDVKKGLRQFYNTSHRSHLYTYEQLEEYFDRAWGNVIEFVDKEELK